MPQRLPLIVLRLALLVALAVSAALLIDYLRPTPAFCQMGSGCDQVRASPLARLLGVPLPTIGLLGFAATMAMSLSFPRGLGRGTVPAALLGGALGAALILTQAFYLRTLCKLCLVVDVAAIVAAAAALWLNAPRAPSEAATRPLRWLWPAAAVLSVVLPLSWGYVQPGPPVPPEIAALWVPGKINVVEFADFQCPFCRQLHPEMTEVLGAYEGRVHFVRLNMPLASHAEARDAARAYCCADDQGKGDEMADALFRAPSLSAEACEILAKRLGLSLALYQGCVASPATERRIDQQMAQVKAAGLRGLPTVWIGEQVLVGLQPSETLREAFAAAASRTAMNTTTHSPGWLWACLALSLAGVAAIALKRPGRSARAGAGSARLSD